MFPPSVPTTDGLSNGAVALLEQARTMRRIEISLDSFISTFVDELVDRGLLREVRRTASLTGADLATFECVTYHEEYVGWAGGRGQHDVELWVERSSGPALLMALDGAEVRASRVFEDSRQLTWRHPLIIDDDGVHFIMFDARLDEWSFNMAASAAAGGAVFDAVLKFPVWWPSPDAACTEILGRGVVERACVGPAEFYMPPNECSRPEWAGAKVTVRTSAARSARAHALLAG
jgi:hypothetical protein